MRNAILTLTHDELRNSMSSKGVPQVYFDQLNVVQQHLQDIRKSHYDKVTPTVTKIQKHN